MMSHLIKIYAFCKLNQLFSSPVLQELISRETLLPYNFLLPIPLIVTAADDNEWGNHNLEITAYRIKVGNVPSASN